MDMPLCYFTVADFTPGASPPLVGRAQFSQESHPFLHDCREGLCPFTKRTVDPMERISVDHQAFPQVVQVKVPLSILGFDSRL
jgi:hypothetical protein